MLCLWSSWEYRYTSEHSVIGLWLCEGEYFEEGFCGDGVNFLKGRTGG